ncbi:TadE/TadG family type IV pilus assembly protein [Pantoea sp. CCBC3-3-1]|uniref:TadE/TadG family type IV pilus assembly protein n=2 Tax=unclassified Pantoea TaxID=2630326 RepID=UPI0011BF3213|nr:TadE/TadG family type IV pilus assembly protein [Pantoea sp. CCBC3-3-1]
MPVISLFKKWMTRQKGALTPAFAIILPALVAMMAFGLDGAQALSQKARLARAVGEASLAVAAGGKYEMSPEEITTAKQIITHYIDYYFPEKLAISHIDIASAFHEVDQDSVSYTGYDISAVIKVPILFTAKMVSGLERNLAIGSGNVRIKKYSSVPADYVLVVDFTNSASRQSFTSLKSVVNEVSEYALKNNPENKIALVPYTIGVPVKLPGKNQRGGQRVGCSLLFVPNEGYDIDYTFWGDKSINNQSTATFNQFMYTMDRGRFDFYRYYVGGLYFNPPTDDVLVLARWCAKNKKYGSKEGRGEYSCHDGNYPDDDIFSERSQRIIASERAKARHVVLMQYKWNSLFNDNAIDYQATLNNMFSNNAVITYPLLWSRSTLSTFRPFQMMCENAGGYNPALPDNDLSQAAPFSWLIELTNDKSELAQVENMSQAGSWTQISSGLVRSVPVMMKGRNKRKVFIIISRRVDYLQPNADVTEKWLKQYQLCEKIKAGIKERGETNTSRVEMYFITYSEGVYAIPIKQAKQWHTIWAEHCVGTNNAATADDKDELLKTIKGFMNDETGHFAS